MGKVLDIFNRYVEALLAREPYGTSADEVREAIRELEAANEKLETTLKILARDPSVRNAMLVLKLRGELW